MIVSINQPSYLPWMGLIDRIGKSDLHIVLDHVQHSRGSFENRNRIRQPDGRVQWLTVPTEKGRPLNRTWVGTGWAKKHRTALRQAYPKHSVHILDGDMVLSTLAWFTTRQLLGAANIWPTVTFSSVLEVPGSKSKLVLNLCKKVGATQYLSGPKGRDYLDLPSFEKAGIEVVWHDYVDPDDPPLSAVHHLFN